MRKYLIVALAAACLLAVPSSPSCGQRKRLAVLSFHNNAGIPRQDVEYVTEILRGSARTVLPRGQYIVMTRENLLELLPPGKDLKSCQGRCEVDAGRKIQAHYIVSGTVFGIGGELVVVIRAFDVQTADLINQVRLRAPDVKGLEAAVEGGAQQLLAALPGAVHAVEPAPGPVPEPSLAGEVSHEGTLTRGASVARTRPATKDGPGPELKKKRHKTWREPVTGLEFVFVPGGCFEMGCGSWTSSCGVDEEPVHETCVDGFWLSRTEVTQGQWMRIMGDNPSADWICGEYCPVENVSWEDASAFARKLSGLNKERSTFRLPSEEEWEYACRSGGLPRKYAGVDSLDLLAWYRSNSDDGAHPVGLKEPNGLGLFDMSGNVWEWCQDVYREDAYADRRRDAPRPGQGKSPRVARGGSWRGTPADVRCATRLYVNQDSRLHNIGFRLVRGE